MYAVFMLGEKTLYHVFIWTKHLYTCVLFVVCADTFKRVSKGGSSAHLSQDEVRV